MKIADDIMYSLFKDEEPNNAIDLLKFDHRNVNAMFVQCLKEEDPEQRSSLVQEIFAALTLHSAAEEKLVYPILNVEDESLSHEAYEEHHVMKMMLDEFAQLNGTETNFIAKVRVLSEFVSHHVMEEEAHMLPKVQHSGFDMRELADKIRAEKDALRASGLKPAGPEPESIKPSKTQPAKATNRKPKAVPKKASKPVAKAAPKASTKAKATPSKKVTPARKPKATTSRKRSAA